MYVHVLTYVLTFVHMPFCLARQAGCTRSPDQCGMAEPHAALADVPAAERLWDETHTALSPWLEA